MAVGDGDDCRRKCVRTARTLRVLERRHHLWTRWCRYSSVRPHAARSTVPSFTHIAGGCAPNTTRVQAYCFCKGALKVTDPLIGYCLSVPHVPEQVNLQASAPGVLVAAFVTFGELPLDSKPVAQVSTSPGLVGAVNVSGVTHTYLSPAADGQTVQEVRKYNMHFVSLGELEERTKYYYRVAAFDAADPPSGPPPPDATECHGWTCTMEGQFCPAGAPGAGANGDRCCGGKWIPGSAECAANATVWSDTFKFTSLYTKGETKIAIFGDMGMMSDGNTVHGNIMRDAAAGAVDAFVHMGDHAYQMSSDDDRRGDGYAPSLTHIV